MATVIQDERLPFVRLLHRDLDLTGFFDAADRELQRRVPFEVSCWLSLDPGGGLPTSHFARDFQFDDFLQLAANEYMEDDVNKFAVLARATRPVGILSQATDGDPERSPRHVRFLAPLGFDHGDELRAVFREGDVVWGALAIHRREGVFSDREADRVAGLGALLAHGIRRAILRTALNTGRDSQPPGLIILRGDDSIDSITPIARSWLGEIFDTTAASGEAPLTLTSLAHQARLADAGQNHEVATVRIPRRSGGWLRMDASMLDDKKDGRVAIIISAARDPELAGLIAQAYGLSTREREVTRLVLNGASTNEIAESLHVSGYTVQDHLKSIFEKVGVRSRRELVAQLFLQQCAPKLAAGAAPGADGWFADDKTPMPSDPVPIR